MDKKAQSSIEMIVTVGIIILIFIVCLIFSQMKIKESNEYTMFLDAKRICRSVANNIDTIAEQGPGYYRYISVPEKIRGGYDYELLTYTKFVEIEWDNPSYSPWNTQIITKNVSFCCHGNCSSGMESSGKIDKGLDKKNKVYNYNGRIIVMCHMPELLLLDGTFLPTEADNDDNITARVEVINFGPNGTRPFDVKFIHLESGREVNTTVDSLGPDNSVIVRANFTKPAYGNYTVLVDYRHNVSEVIEDNNNITVEVRLI